MHLQTPAHLGPEIVTHTIFDGYTNARYPLPVTESSTLTRAELAPHEIRLAAQYETFSQALNSMAGDPTSSLWGWHNTWFRGDNSPYVYNSRNQELVAVDAFFYTHNADWNDYHRNPGIWLKLEAGIRYMLSLQNSDGSWSTFVRGQAYQASTAFAVHAFGEMYRMLTDADAWLYESLKRDVEFSLVSGVNWLLASGTLIEQANRLSNIAYATLDGIATNLSILPPRLVTLFNEALTAVIDNSVSQAGHLWEEYGADFGYSSGVAFIHIASLYRKIEDARLVAVMQSHVTWMGYNYLQEPEGYIVNDGITTRGPGATLQLERYVEHRGSVNVGAVFSATVPGIHAYLTSREYWDNFDIAWLAGSGINGLTRGFYSPANITQYNTWDSSMLPTLAQQSAAADALPYRVGSFTKYLSTDIPGDNRFKNAVTYVNRPSYYLGMAWLSNDGDGDRRFGTSFLYHPDMGTLIATQRGNNCYWGVRTFESERFDTTSIVPDTVTTFSVALTGPNVNRTIACEFGRVVVTATRTGNFVERVPLVIRPGDTIRVETALNVFDTVTGDYTFTNARSIRVSRNGRELQISRATLFSGILRAAVPGSYNSMFDRTVRYLDFNATDTFNYALTTVAL